MTYGTSREISGAGPVREQPHPCSAPKALVTWEAPPPHRAAKRAVGAPAPAARAGRPVRGHPQGLISQGYLYGMSNTNRG